MKSEHRQPKVESEPNNNVLTTREEDKVSLSEKISLGVGSLALFYGNNGVKALAVPVYQMVLNMNPAVLGLLLAVPRLWDACTDPLVGMFSDNFRSRFGRRKPIIVVGAFLQALAFGLIWMVPRGWSSTSVVVYLSAALLLFYTCFSVFSVPLLSLTYEMTPDYQERTRVSGFGAFFWKAGEITYSWVFWLANLAIFTDVVQGVRTLGWIIAIVIMGILAALPGFVVKERQFVRTKTQERVRFRPAIRAAMSNRSFLILVALTVSQIIAGILCSNIDYYILVYHVYGGSIVEGSKWKAVLSTSYAMVGMLSLVPLGWAANKYGKRVTLIATFALVLIDGPVRWIVFTPGNPWRIIADAVLGAPVWSAIAMLTPSMVADICDDDEHRHGLRREGLLGALFSWVQKAGFGVGFFGAGLALNLAHFDASLGGNQSPETILHMRLILSVSTVVWAVMAIALLYFYPLSKSRVYQIRDELEARRGTSPSL